MNYEDIDLKLRMLVDKNERLLWFGKPNLLCFVLQIAFYPLSIIPIIFGIVCIVCGLIISSKNHISQVIVPMVGLFIVALPFWLYLWVSLTSFIRHRNTFYIITNEAIYISDGVIFRTFTRNPIDKISPPEIHISKFGKLFGVGDVMTYKYNDINRNTDPSLKAIKGYQEVYEIIKNLQCKKDGFNNYMQNPTSDISIIK